VRPIIQTAESRYRPQKYKVDVVLKERSQLSGYILFFEDEKDMPIYSPNISSVRLVGLTTDAKGRTEEATPLGSYLVPQTQSTFLLFDLDSSYHLNVVTFEFVPLSPSQPPLLPRVQLLGQN
jgi:hypothetical protein